MIPSKRGQLIYRKHCIHPARAVRCGLTACFRSNVEIVEILLDGEQNEKFAKLLPCSPRTCTVAVKDARDVERSIEVTPETLDEAIATAFAGLQQDSWVAEIGQGFIDSERSRPAAALKT